MRGVQGVIEGFLNDPDEGVRRAAVGYLLIMSLPRSVFRYAPELTARAFSVGPDESAVVQAELDARFVGEEKAPLAALTPRIAAGSSSPC